MKKAFLLLALLLVSSVSFAQKTAYVNTQTIFKAIREYKTAIETIDKLSAQYQQKIDDEYAAIDQLYNEYQRVKSQLSASSRKSREDDIIQRERALKQYQEQIFGQEGEIMRKRIELIRPIQDRVFNAVKMVAKNRGYQSVVDLANNPTIIYYDPALDLTKEIMRILGVS